MCWFRVVCFSIALVVAFFSVEGQATTLYSLDRAFHPDAMRLVRFDSDPGNSELTTLFPLPGLPSNPPGAHMSFSPDGRLFVLPYGTTIYEIDPGVGTILGSFNIGGSQFEGMTVGSNGLIYASQEIHGGGAMWAVDFDQRQATNFVTGSFEIDHIDFDDLGNLIGNDINQSGQLFRIPLDGSQPVPIATIPVSIVGSMTFGPQDSAFYFISDEDLPGGRFLRRLPWADGQPAGPMEQVKLVGGGQYVGITSGPAPVPEPSTLLLLGSGLVGLGGLAWRWQRI